VLLVVAGCAAGSPLAHTFLGASGWARPLAFVRLWVLMALLGLALRAIRAQGGDPSVRPHLAASVAMSLLAGGASAVGADRFVPPAGPVRLPGPPAYSKEAPHFCGGALGWWSPAADGRSLERRSDDPGYRPCVEARPGAGSAALSPDGRRSAIARFRDGSWDIAVTHEGQPEWWISLGRSNERDPAWTPDGQAIVFASDLGRGLGSHALYRVAIPPSR
jgi:hypothetical protein